MPDRRSRLARTALKYALVQLPSAALVLIGLLLLRAWVGTPGWLVGVLFAGWLLKDLLLFPLVRRAYEPEEHVSGGTLIGMCGTARERLAPAGYILIRGELWRAELPEGVPPVEKGERIMVLGLRGLTLLVEPGDCRRH